MTETMKDKGSFRREERGSISTENAVVALIDRRQERDAKALVAMIHDGRTEDFAAEMEARSERLNRLREKH